VCVNGKKKECEPINLWNYENLMFINCKW
jgi:hypothetical protein